MRVLITRPREDALVTAQILHRLGVRSVLEPLFKIIFAQTTPEIQSAYQALVFTSRNAVKAFGYRFPDVHAPTYCSGDHTAETAEDYGLKPLIAVEGDARDLLTRLQQDLRPENGPVFRVTAEGDEDPLAAQLQEQGFTVEQVPLYRVQPIHALSRSTINLIQRGGIDGVLFFSPRAASQFVQLIEQEVGLAAQLQTLHAWCINDMTADSLAGLVFKNKHVAATPTHDALVEAITMTKTGQDNDRE